MREYSTGCMLVLLHVVNIISAFDKCYQVNCLKYCFYTNDSVLSWDDAREFCRNKNSTFTLPIITDEDIDNVFQRFISDSNNTNNYVWLDAHAHDVDNDNSAQLHWINGKDSSNHTLFSFKTLNLFYAYCIGIGMSVDWNYSITGYTPV